MEIRGQIHVLKLDTGKEDERWPYLVSFYPLQGVGPAPHHTCHGLDELRKFLGEQLDIRGDDLDRTLKEAEQGKNHSLELIANQDRLQECGLI
jgi:hypothetical protein